MSKRYDDNNDDLDMILNLTEDAMIAIDDNTCITLFNNSAEKMTGLDKQTVRGVPIHQVIPSSKLPRVLATGSAETNQEQLLDNGKKIITTRRPIHKAEQIVGAFAVFKDVTDFVNMAEEVTNLKSIQTMLEAIIQSSEEAISVVDENGKGILINPAYTKLTGLSEDQVINQPATTDISEGESMHMRVLKTRKPVRGALMKVGPNKRDVVVNVAPVIVDGVLKGSVGVLHDMSEIKSLTKELQRARQIIRNLEAKYAFDDIIGTSDDMSLVIKQAELSAQTPVNVLLRGESGTGKELFAHAIHNASDRKYNRFVRVNCAAITESLLESELFGYEEGAFSGAKRGGKRGLFEEADGGSIFLDEIGELSGHMQAKLLRVLHEKELIKVGGTKPKQINVRVIAATNVNLEKKIAEGAFREDLYYRLNKMPIVIPPLRNRKEDLPQLCEHLLNKLNQDYGRHVAGITKEAIELLSSYHWPGNVRELENILGRAMIQMSLYESHIQRRHIPPLILHQSETDQVVPVESQPEGNLQSIMATYEKRVILETLKRYDFNKTKTAHALGVSVRNLYYKLNKHNLDNVGMQ